ncbi:hypothetical protein P175DRAFT_0434178 [Aspergillus ochraceoroseus IBT 24754]|uniref:Uncharacterized protein n=1 Tax=Aspergillus ochraceoroseus IBT 24754 TaxID=1392256 RepID=A0A2T5LZL7_9EURO|nr:uncharacterized protein P175DRAFT_0434178 [Aspergillus ochraceoroseus IBT 24754]PTU21725.1 hypothetical protein P175DRAFT_0434178 [Aspergillus ochraceoroseus IBT 24754]
MEDIRPTAKWANRMLRPLTSIYHRLEKHHEIVTRVLTSKTKEKASAGLGTERARGPAKATALRAKCEQQQQQHQGLGYSDEEEPNDPAWIPGGKKLEKRRIRHNYSSRGQRNGARKRSRLSIRSPETHKILPGAIEIATPLITGKARGGVDELPSSSSSIRIQLFQNAVAHGETAAGVEEQRKTSRATNSSFTPYQGSWKEILDQSGDPGFVGIAHLLDRVFLKFLRSTRVVSPGGFNSPQGSGRGARSLLSMAVRRLPEFIADEQRIQDEEDESCEVDMCDAYFTELEASYAPGGNGWIPLREAVRSQGIYLVSCMIQRGWITNLAACRLLEECLSQDELDAFETLLTKYLATVDAYPYPTTFDSRRPPGHRDDPVHLLGVYYSRPGRRRSYVFEELTRLLMRQAVPPEWMVTTFWKRCVDSAIKSLSIEDRDSAAARRLIESVILSAAGVHSTTPGSNDLRIRNLRPPHPVRLRDTRASTAQTSAPVEEQSPCPIPIQDALSNLVASLMTALCGMCMARSQADSFKARTVGMKIRDLVNHLAFAVQRTIGLEPMTTEVEGPVFQPLRRGYVLLSDCALECGRKITAEMIYHSESVSRQAIESFFRALSSRQDVVKELAELVSKVFHYSGPPGHHDRGPVRTPKEIRAKVSQLSQLTRTPGVALLLGKVAADSAMELAEKSLDSDDHAWALEIQETVVSSQREESLERFPLSSQEESGRDRTGLYRWEDIIGEWVARTPPVTGSRTAAIDIAMKQRIGRPEQPRAIACSTSSSSASSICSENTISSVTSSAPSISKKRPSASEPSSPRPFKKASQAQSLQRLVGNEIDWRRIPGRLPLASLSAGSASNDTPVAARTRTAQREMLQMRTLTAREHGTSAMNNPVEPLSRIEVVIINKKNTLSTPGRGFKDYHDREPISRRTRRSLPFSRTNIERSRRRQSAPATAAAATRRQTISSGSSPRVEDSEDELSFL